MRTRLLVATLASLAFAGTAVAQDAPVEEGMPSEGQPSEGEAMPADGGDPGMGEGTVDAAGGGRWPRSVIARPLTLPKGIWAVGGDLLNRTSDFFDPAILRLSGAYGIDDKLELGFASYTFPLSGDSAGKGFIDVDVGYAVARGAAGGKLEVVARGQVGYGVFEVPSGTGETEAYGLTPLAIGAQVRYLVTEKISLTTGSPSAPIFPMGASIPGLGGTVPQLAIGLQDGTPVVLRLPVGVGFQATPELYLQLDTNLTNIVISEGDYMAESTFIFSDSTPLNLTATYNAMPALDVIGGLSFDATPPEGVDFGDTMVLLLGARYYGGNL